MKKVAVFGKSGGGKSVFSKKLSESTGITHFPLDLIEYIDGGDKVPEDKFLEKYNEILLKESWIIDGFGTMDTFRERLNHADTLIYIDLPAWLHYGYVTKRFLLSLLVKPQGWPDRSPMIKSTYNCYIHLYRDAPKFWNANFLTKINNMSQTKNVIHLKSKKEIRHYIESCT